MTKKNIIPKNYSSESRTFYIRTKTGFDMTVYFSVSSNSTNARNLVFNRISSTPRLPGVTDYGECIHCRTSVRADMLAELDRVMRVSGNPNYSIIREEHSISFWFDMNKGVSFYAVGVPGQDQVQCRVCCGADRSRKEPSEIMIPVDIKKRDQLLSKFRDIYAKLYTYYDFPEAARKKALKEALKGRPYKIEFSDIKHAFCFSSPAIPQEVWVEVRWNYLRVDAYKLEPGSTSIIIGTLMGKEAFWSPNFGFRELMVGPYTGEITCGPTNKAEIKKVVMRCLKEAGVPVTRLLREYIHMSMTDFRYDLTLDFMGVPGHGQLKCKLSYFIDIGYPYLDIKDLDEVFAFAKRLFTLNKKFRNGRISDDERLEFLELYNEVGDYDEDSNI